MTLGGTALLAIAFVARGQGVAKSHQQTAALSGLPFMTAPYKS